MPRRLLPLLLAIAVVPVLASPAAAKRTAAWQASAAVGRAHTFLLPRAATHVAVHWRGQRHARVWVAFSRDGRRFGPERRVALDELGEQTRGRETWGAIVRAQRALAVRVRTDRRLARLSVLALADRGGPAPRTHPAAWAAAVSQPKVIPRVGWGADESLRFDSSGREIWPPAFYPVQKLIVHHTDTQNSDPNPAATMRSIYYYHAITQGWGDIGYNFLIDEAGNVYEGRHTYDYPSGSSPTEQDSSGRGVTAAHAQGYNSGTVGIALLGTLSNQNATPAARNALEHLLAWIAGTHGIDPRGSSLYVNPVSGAQATFPNIAGHRDVGATECPGGAFYATLPTIRSDVAALISGSSPPPALPTAVTGGATSVGQSTATVSGTVNPGGQATTWRFQYGRTTSYGNGAPSPAGNAGAGTSAVSVSTTLSGLRRKTTYHYRLTATNASGTARGADATFRTK